MCCTQNVKDRDKDKGVLRKEKGVLGSENDTYCWTNTECQNDSYFVTGGVYK